MYLSTPEQSLAAESFETDRSHNHQQELISNRASTKNRLNEKTSKTNQGPDYVSDLDFSDSVKKVSFDRTTETEDQYVIRVRGFYRQSSERRTIDPQNPVAASPLDVVDDLIAAASVGPLGEPPKIAYQSWALYRTAMLFHLSSRRQDNDIFEDAYLKLAATKQPCEALMAKSRSKRTFAIGHFEQLINELGKLNKRNFRGSQTAYWLKAGVAAGARGIEWAETEWLDREKLQLLIPNSKRKVSTPAFIKIAQAQAKYGKTFNTVYDIEAEERRQSESEFFNPNEDAWSEINEDDSDIEFASQKDHEIIDIGTHRIVRINSADAMYVDLHLASISRNTLTQAQNGIGKELAFMHYYEMARRALRIACKSAFKGKHFYRLYTTRSQFAANSKVDHSIGVVAEMMGHSSTRTTMSSYGSRAAGLKGRKAMNEIMQLITEEAFKPEGFSTGEGESGGELDLDVFK